MTRSRIRDYSLSHANPPRVALMEKQMNQQQANKPTLVAKWDDSRRFMPIGRDDAAQMLRGNRRNGVQVYRKHGELHIKGHGVCFVIAKSAEAAA